MLNSTYAKVGLVFAAGVIGGLVTLGFDALVRWLS